MIRPIVHRQLTRGDLACLVEEIARMDVTEGREADQALQAGAVDTVLDSPAALEAVLGRGGAPAPLPLTLLWYIPIRAQLRTRGVTDILLADYAATLPVVFATSHSQNRIAQGENGMAEWWRFVAALPQGTVAQAEAAADTAALALWWSGCFPEWVERGGTGGGRGMVRAYVTFAGRMLGLAADLLEASAPEEAALCARAAEARTELHAALIEARADYIGEDPHSSESRLNRFLRRLADN
ncbi:MAG TPA: hypothetical protein VGQ48_03725 [Gemmatimonadales bacterium]|jgi:hypothetical protein|nr:hypothetical protein [Gemmatimonadales bacterium]